jgi:hypothetical protein
VAGIGSILVTPGSVIRSVGKGSQIGRAEFAAKCAASALGWTASSEADGKALEVSQSLDTQWLTGAWPLFSPWVRWTLTSCKIHPADRPRLRRGPRLSACYAKKLREALLFRGPSAALQGSGWDPRHLKDGVHGDSQPLRVFLLPGRSAGSRAGARQLRSLYPLRASLPTHLIRPERVPPESFSLRVQNAAFVCAWTAHLRVGIA